MHGCIMYDICIISSRFAKSENIRTIFKTALKVLWTCMRLGLYNIKIRISMHDPSKACVLVALRSMYNRPILLSLFLST